MGGRLRRLGIAAAALSILMVGGAATIAWADIGSPPHATHQFAPQKAWFSESVHHATQIAPDRPWFSAVPGSSHGTPAGQPSSSRSSRTPLLVVAGIGVATLIGLTLLLATRRRRGRLAYTG